MLLLFGAAVIAATALAIEIPSSHADRILAHGSTTAATVVEVHGWTGYPDIVLRYEYQGAEYTVRRGSNDDSPDLNVGDTLVMSVDPKDPAWATSADLDPSPAWVTDLILLGFLTGLPSLTLGCVLVLRHR